MAEESGSNMSDAYLGGVGLEPVRTSGDRSGRLLKSIVWGGEAFGISTENAENVKSWNPTCSWYQYGTGLGLNGCQHPGMDIGMEIGTPIFACVAGKVLFAGPDQFYAPNHIDLLTSGGQKHIYGHLSKVNASVVVGSQVEAGQSLGLSGTAGTGGHLHFEVRQRSDDCSSGWCSIDPEPSLRSDNVPVTTVNFDIGDHIKVIDPPLNFREAPRGVAAIIRSLDLGTEMVVVGAPRSADGKQWFPVRLKDDTVGWVAGVFCGPA
jgi:murein DD-endopeptidase MepM/ murein hydrolase activator NlpD